MHKSNTNTLKKWILEETSSSDLENQIEMIIGAFSEFIVAVNPDYQYNKTYLISYISSFIECQKFIKEKYLILQNDIVEQLRCKEIEIADIEVHMDGIWTFKENKCELSNSISVKNAKSKWIRLEFKYLGEKSFVLTHEICMENLQKDEINEIVNKFVDLVRGIK